jgi:hypothetical protein
MAGARRSGSHCRSHLGRAGTGRIYRGSAKRIRRIKCRKHTPRGFAAFVFAMVAIMVGMITWLTTHSEDGHHDDGLVTVDSR